MLVEPTEMQIDFYRERDDYGYMSNFSKHSFIDSFGRYWLTSEHYYQAMKFLNHEDQEYVRTATDPMMAKTRGQERRESFVHNWEDIKVGVMLDALRYKFNEHRDIKEALINTGYSYIVEKSPSDLVWGSGVSYTGANLLGCCLMLVRAELQLKYGGKNAKQR